jgi:hypothetical protein
VNGDVMAQQMNEQTNKSDAIALTTPREPLDRRRGGKLGRARTLHFPAYTLLGHNTGSEKIFSFETFCGSN